MKWDSSCLTDSTAGFSRIQQDSLPVRYTLASPLLRPMRVLLIHAMCVPGADNANAYASALDICNLCNRAQGTLTIKAKHQDTQRDLKG